MKRTELKTFASGFLAEQKLGVLSTFSEEYPYTSLVGFSVTPGMDLVFATKKDTHKFFNLEKDPRVSLLVNNAFEKKEDLKSATAVTVLGRAQEVKDPEKENYYKRLLLEKNPFLSEFLADADSAVVQIDASKFIVVKNFQEVWEIEA